ncbi:MAG TPA: tetratricopeptide repeat protein [Ignavibacteriales bacterium]|nr:tetratricopeptide repeat protein [Ignavibacteriales bacterium]
MKKLASFIVLFALVSLAKAQDAAAISEALAKGKQLTEDGFYSFDKNKFVEAHNLFERILSADPDNNEAKYYIALAESRLVTIAAVKDDDDLYDKYVDLAEASGEKVMSLKGYEDEGRVVLANTLMMEIVKSSIKGALLSGKINDLIDEALEKNPSNPRAYMIKGAMKLNTPSFFGGSVEKAIENFNKAVKIYEDGKGNNNGVSWGHAEALSWLGQALMRDGKAKEAAEAYNKALALRPDYGHVKYVLLPQVEEQLKQTAAEGK